MKFEFEIELKRDGGSARQKGAVVACCKVSATNIVNETFKMFGQPKLRKLVRVAHKIPVGKAIDYGRKA
jgi:hypothetical protein